MKNYLFVMITCMFVSHISLSQTLSVSTHSIQLAAGDESTASFTITSDTYWGIYNIPDWITADTVWGSGNRVMNIVAEENAFTINRKAEIVVYCVNENWEYFADTKISITQSASTYGISDTTISIGAATGSSTIFSVNSQTYWEITEKPSWIMVNKNSFSSSASITATAVKNPLIINRIGYITIKRLGTSGEYIYGTVKIIQEASDIGISAERVDLSYQEGSSQQILINNNTAWSISGEADWVTTTPSAKDNNGFTTITVQENMETYYRIDTITVACDNQTNYHIIITQDPAPAQVVFNPSIFHFPENQLTLSIEATANTNWGIIDFPEWIETENVYRWGNSTFELTADSWIEERKATATVYWFDEYEKYHQRNVTIIQTSRNNVNIENVQLHNSIVFPNPVTTTFSVNLPHSNIFSIQLLATNGNILKTWNNNYDTMDIRSFCEGVYYVKIIGTDNTVLIQPIIKNTK
ncbi:MAG: BACON domain-containing protein [Bacteroidota bacterium]